MKPKPPISKGARLFSPSFCGMSSSTVLMERGMFVLKPWFMVPLAQKREIVAEHGRRMGIMSKRFWFWPIDGLVLLGIVLAGAEYTASWSAPSQWTDRDTQLSAQHIADAQLSSRQDQAAAHAPADRPSAGRSLPAR